MRKLVALTTLLLLLAAPASASADSSVRDLQYWLSEYGFDAAWTISRGQGVKVAVIDTGIDASHPDLVGKVVAGWDASGLGDERGTKPVGENSYHGTMVASLLAGSGKGGVIGVAPAADLLSVSVAFGIDSLDTDGQIARGIRWAVDNGARVINLSLTRNTTSWPVSWDEAFLYAFEHDVVVVASVGNRAEGTEAISAPANIPGVLSVGGVDREGQPSEQFSTDGFTMAVAAPAESLVAAYPGGEYRLFSGSSAAAPLVAGLAALIRSAHPEINAESVIKQIITTTRQRQYSPELGYGIIDAQAALSNEVALATLNPLGDLSEWIKLYRSSSEVAASEFEAPIDAPIELGEAPIRQPVGSIWLPMLGYAGVGLLAIFLYFSFRPRRPENQTSTRK